MNRQYKGCFHNGLMCMSGWISEKQLENLSTS